MRLEKDIHTSETNNIFYFKEWCRKEGVNLFLFDADDTLWKTVPVFRKFMADCYDYLALNAPVLDREGWKKAIQEVNDRFFEIYGVNPTRWAHVMTELSQQFGLSDTNRDRAVEILMQIYNTPPQFLEGTEKGLAFLRQADVPFGIVTHANEEWTKRKYDWLNLSRFIKWEQIFIVNEDGHKTAESWAQAISYFGSTPERCAIVGDSPRSDINPASQIGVRHCFLFETNSNRWSIHNQAVPETTITISNIGELIKLGR
jgi:FMN phosphatase YigB (HAD superfamily)